MEAHKVKACTMTRQGPMHRWRSKARPHAPMEVQSAMGHAKAKAVKSERAMKAKRGTSTQMKLQRAKGYIIERGGACRDGGP